MALQMLPRQLRQRSEFYHQLAQLVSAGVTLPNALEHIRRSPPGRSYRAALDRILADLKQGCTFSDSLFRLGRWAPEFDLALLQAGEQSGRIDTCLRLLSEYYDDRARVARQMIADLIYPLFLFHFAVLVFSFVGFVTSGNWTGFAVQLVALLLPIYFAVLLVIYASQGRHSEAWRATMERVFRAVPVLGGARRALALGRLAAALEALLAAGVNILDAWETAAAASGSPALRRAVLAWRPQLEAGVTPAEAMKRSRAFPDLFADQYATGEISGSLDDVLRRLHGYYQEDGTRKLHAFTQWTPRMIYLLVMLGIGFFVVRWWANYFQQIGNAAGF